MLKIEFKKNKIVVYGFSLGAYSAIQLATVMKINKLILVSPSPLFKEVVNKISNTEKKKVILENLKTIKSVCHKINCKTKIYIGSEEDELILETAEKIAKELKIKVNVLNGYKHEERLFKKVLKID